MDSKTTEDKTRTKRVPPIVLPDSEDRDELYRRLRYFAATCSGHKWDETNTNSKTKKFLARTGFHSLFWSAVLLDDNLLDILKAFFADNITYISDNQFETTFGIALNPTADLTEVQLRVNFFLFFALPAKSHTKYLHEWTNKRIKSLYAMLNVYDRENLVFDVRQEVFAETKRRFRAYKELVPVLTKYIHIESKNLGSYLSEQTRTPHQKLMYCMFRVILIAIEYSGLQTFKMSWDYSQCLKFYEVSKLESVKEDSERLKTNRQLIIDKYGEGWLPYARLLNLPEAEGLDRKHYPDLAFCAYNWKLNEAKERTEDPIKHMRLRAIQTKAPILELKRLSTVKKDIPLSELFPQLFRRTTDPTTDDLSSKLSRQLSLSDLYGEEDHLFDLDDNCFGDQFMDDMIDMEDLLDF